MAPKVKTKQKVKTFRAALKRTAGSHRGGQGYNVMDFDGEQHTVNKEWAAKCKSPTDPYHDTTN